jgi:hypothetical protein
MNHSRMLTYHLTFIKEFIISHNFHKLPWSIQFNSVNNAKKITMMWPQGYTNTTVNILNSYI